MPCPTLKRQVVVDLCNRPVSRLKRLAFSLRRGHPSRVIILTVGVDAIPNQSRRPSFQCIVALAIGATEQLSHHQFHGSHRDRVSRSRIQLRIPHRWGIRVWHSSTLGRPKRRSRRHSLPENGDRKGTRRGQQGGQKGDMTGQTDAHRLISMSKHRLACPIRTPCPKMRTRCGHDADIKRTSSGQRATSPCGRSRRPSSWLAHGTRLGQLPVASRLARAAAQQTPVSQLQPGPGRRPRARVRAAGRIPATAARAPPSSPMGWRTSRRRATRRPRSRGGAAARNARARGAVWKWCRAALGRGQVIARPHSLRTRPRREQPTTPGDGMRREG